jgi:hypothetical protein
MEYTFSLSNSNSEEIKKCFNDNGVVVISDVLTKDECKTTWDEVGSQMTALNNKFDITKFSTYEHAPLINRHGLYSRHPIFSPQLIKNRTNPNLQRAFELLYGHNKLMASHDRVGLMRPTQVKNHEHPEWENFFSYPGLHLDLDLVGYYQEHSRITDTLNSLTYSSMRDFVRENNIRTSSMGVSVQGVLNILPNRFEDGGFHCAVGAHKHLDTWWDKLSKTDYKLPEGGQYIFNLDKPLDKELIKDPPVRIPCEAGSLILFDAKLPHGTQPNKSSKPRLAQFIRMLPKDIFDTRTLSNRDKALRKQYKLCGYVV